MTQIEHRVECEGVTVPDYSGRQFSEQEIANGRHRSYIGGRWDELGPEQLNFLTAHGLQPDHRLIDVGCGCFRAGRYLIDALEQGHYYGIDANLQLLQLGYDTELSDEQRTRLPVENLRANDRFDVDFGVMFDMAIAQSVFTHIPLNHIRLCMYRLAKVMRPGGKFYATFFEQPESVPIDKIVIRRKGGRPFLNEQDIFWYHRSDMEWVATFGPWRARYIGDWQHPAGQMMMEYTRVEDRSPRPAATRSGSRNLPLRDQARSLVEQARRWAARRIEPDASR